MGESWNLYTDSETRDTITQEAKRVHLSPSAWLRVIGRILREPVNDVLTLTVSEFREHIRKIVEETERRV